MFTNWLTGTSGTNNQNNNNNSNSNQNNNNNNSFNTNNPLMHNSFENRANSSNSHLIANPAGHILMSTPPDVVLEVGPTPSTVRFVAHSIVLGMHSGYLRSAIRLDEHILAERNAASSATGAAGSPDFVLFLSNVTAEQFAPLLTYMYTGYLDLNIENIFGVLLATHVLHMPRALEICRSFLARAQTEGYLGARLAAAANSNAPTNTNNHQTANNLSNSNNNNISSNKIIRPIPSKATMPHFGYLAAMPPPATTTAATPQQHQQQHNHQTQHATMPLMLANFKQLQRQSESLYQTQQQHHQQHQQQLALENDSNTTTNMQIKQNERAKSEEIDVDQESIKASSEIDDKSDKDATIIKVHNEEDNDDEDEEVFIDSSDDIDNIDSDNDDMEVIIEVKQNNKNLKNQNKQKTKHQQEQKQKQTKTTMTTTKSKEEKKPNAKTERNKKIDAIKKDSNSNTNNNRHQHQQQTKQRRTHKSTRSGLQIAKAPIPASQLDCNEGSKVIIDVASCDGPVRFRRILNTAYGHKPEDFTTQMPERSQQSVSYSFHQQMARTIHHQQQQQQQRHQLQKQNGLGEDSENSESSGGGIGGVGSRHASKNAAQLNSNEIYVCVYCKHTFKSQYCYQKHAKRHLNPLSLNPTERCDKTIIDAANTAATASAVNLNFNAAQFNSSNATTGCGVGGAQGIGSCLPLPLLTTKQTANDLLRREVRPLDMNVQYYPCKTCGSKFPSYYFVHKHRKLCHADEELNNVALEKAKNTNALGNVNDSAANSNNNEDIVKDQQSNASDLVDFKINSPESNINNVSNADDNTEEPAQPTQEVKHER